MSLTRETTASLIVMAGLLGIPLWAEAAGEPFTITLATRVALFALAGIGLNLALGMGGMVSLGHAVFFGIGGYAMGILASHAQSFTSLASWPILIEGTKSMPIIWLVAVLSSALAALAIGALTLRTSGVYFIMITLAFGQMFFYFMTGWPAYGGEDGLSIYVRNGFPGLNTLDPIQFFAICFVFLAGALWLYIRIDASPFGLTLAAARQNEARLRAVGIDPFRIRLVAFTLSGAITGLAGALFADLNRFVSPAMFSWQTSGEIVIFVILGGVGRPIGPVVGAGLYVLLEHSLGDVSDYWQIVLGAILLAIVLFARGGLTGLVLGRPVPHG
ncbi:MAG: branched-chain amino acid ABC transporter permease [Pseudomonadota bacterium]